MGKTLYVTYTPKDLSQHAQLAVDIAKTEGWEVVVGPKMGSDRAARLSNVAKADAVLLLSAVWYSDDGGNVRPIQVDEWEAAQRANKARRALVVKPNSNWNLEQVEYSAWQQLQAFQEDLRKSRDVEEFDSTVESVKEAAVKQLTALGDTVSPKPPTRVFVVWDSTTPGLEVILTSLKKRPPNGMTIQVPALSTEVGAGEIFRNIVLPGIQKSERVLVITDRPNANVAFEAGLALGFRKPISLVHFGPVVPEWVKLSVFRGFVDQKVGGLEELKNTLQNQDAWYPPVAAPELPRLGRTLFLSPSKYVGEALELEREVVRPYWKRVPEQLVANELSEALQSIAQVVWSITLFSEGTEQRDGSDNAANAVIFGWFYARARSEDRAGDKKRFWVLRQEEAREVADVLAMERRFRHVDKYADLLQEIPEYDLPTPVWHEERTVSEAVYQMVKIERVESEGLKSSLWAGVYPVTNKQYLCFCKAKSYPPPPYLEGDNFEEHAPVVCVSYEDAQQFCNWAELTLPDAELWKELALAGSKSRFWWGDNEEIIEKVGWYSRNSEGRVHRVGELPANPWGLHDVIGNVWEWTEKFSELRQDPRGDREGTLWSARVFGGAYDTISSKLAFPRILELGAKEPSIGFRCVRLVLS